MVVRHNNSVTPTGCPVIQFNSDTTHLAETHRLRAESSIRLLDFSKSYNPETAKWKQFIDQGLGVGRGAVGAGGGG